MIIYRILLLPFIVMTAILYLYNSLLLITIKWIFKGRGVISDRIIEIINDLLDEIIINKK